MSRDPNKKRIIVKLLNNVNGFGVVFLCDDRNETVDSFIKRAKLHFYDYAKDCDGLLLMPLYTSLNNSDNFYNIIVDRDTVILFEKALFKVPDKEFLASLGDRLTKSYDYLKHLSYKELIEVAWGDSEELGKILNYAEQSVQNLKIACLNELEERQRNRVI